LLDNVSEGLAQGPYMATRVGFEHLTEGTELTTELPSSTILLLQLPYIRWISNGDA